MSRTRPSVRCMVKAYRQHKGLSQEELAELVKVRRQAIYDIESGRYLPNTAVALRLARVFACTVEMLFVEESASGTENIRLLGDHVSPVARLALGRVRGELVGAPLQGMEAMSFHVRSPDAVWQGNTGQIDLLLPNSEIEKNVLILGCDPALALLHEQMARVLPGVRAHTIFASSSKALHTLAEGGAHIAGTHFHSFGAAEANLKAVETMLPEMHCLIMGFSVQEEGLMVATKNPLNIRGIDSLADKKIRFVNREKGAALRTLLDKELLKKGIPTYAVPGYDNEVFSHCEGAFHVACNVADAALGLRVIAESFGIGFVPLAVTRCDLVIPFDLQQHPGVTALLDILQSVTLKAALQTLPGYDAECTGKIISA